jgi:predicted dehydrogenase
MIKLGIVGMSPGNGHPYSWSAIFNGYNSQEMKSCDFPIIPEYLAKQRWPDCQIKSAVVESIYTGETEIATHVAKSSNIENVYTDLNLFIEYSDAFLLARDDVTDRYEILTKLIETKKPIFVDKPISNSIEMLEDIYSLEKYPGQIFSCTCLRYSPEMKISESEIKEIGLLKEIKAYVSGDWDKYSVHIIEPVVNLIGSNIKEIKLSEKNNSETIVTTSWDNDVQAKFYCSNLGKYSLKISVIGTEKTIELVFTDSFLSFKSGLLAFIDHITNGNNVIEHDFHKKSVKIIEAGIGRSNE